MNTNWLIKNGVSIMLIGFGVWIVTCYRLRHPIWNPVHADFEWRTNINQDVEFQINTPGNYEFLLTVLRENIPNRLTAHFEDWRVPGEVECDMVFELSDGQAIVIAKAVSKLKPYGSTRDRIIYSLGEMELPRIGNFLLRITNSRNLQLFASANAKLSVRLSPNILKKRMTEEIIGRVVAVGAGVLGIILICAGLLRRRMHV